MRMTGAAAKAAMEKERTELKAQYALWSAEEIQSMNLRNSELALKFARAGKAVFKRWVSLHDGKTRDSHLQADGQFQVLEDPFKVGVELAYYPGDNALSAKERINCRCIVIFEDADGRDLLSYRTQRAGKKRIDSLLAQFSAQTETFMNECHGSDGRFCEVHGVTHRSTEALEKSRATIDANQKEYNRRVAEIASKLSEKKAANFLLKEAYAHTIWKQIQKENEERKKRERSGNPTSPSISAS